MKFSQIIGKCDPKLIIQAEDALSAIFVELCMSYRTKAFGSMLGGDIFLHQLVSPLKHICDARAIEFEEECSKIEQNYNDGKITKEEQNDLIALLYLRLGKRLLYTAGTNGNTYFWAPQFIIKLSKVGLRLVVGHEGWHSIYMHPSRRGSRNPALWNIAVDFKVNYTLMEDLSARGFTSPADIFRKELGDFVSLQEYADFLKDPFNPPVKLAGWNPMNALKESAGSSHKNPNDKTSFYYAEPNLSNEFKKPENIYDYLISQIPKCSTCGKIGTWKKPQEFKDLEKKLNAKRKK